MSEPSNSSPKLLISTVPITPSRSRGGEEESLTSRTKSNATEVLETTGGEMGSKLAELCLDISSRLQEKLDSAKPKSFEIEMNLGFDGKTNFVLGELGASSGIKVTLKW